ncbi:hypothetical protein NQ315_011573 [Exocentrus adspersus]|uniref:Peptidase S1 domain-containing protein n=1 Tax=Exocentrus adspersus TaxID=1586481 RepID=A0AAV8VWT7_9CUCU|nr:hypothetical protein NQ315_011573 [Exocentrus adspersus]
MKIVACLVALLNLSATVPSPPQLPWNEIKGINVNVEPISNYTVVDEPIDRRIIGGDEVEPHSRPYQVALLINGRSFCAGSLISPNFVLTAAHCTISASYVELILGAHNPSIEEPTQIRVTSTNLIIHENYTKPNKHSNDISLIKTPEYIVTNSYIQIVELADADAGGYDWSVSVLSGWGSTSDSNSSISSGLREIYLYVQSSYLCAKFYGADVITSASICTSGDGIIGGCHGDSGSPLVVGKTQVGVLSFISSEGCESGYPTGYSRLLPWNEIKEKSFYAEPILAFNYTPNIHNDVDGRIIGGHEAQPHSRPYQVALIINGENFCSGSLISPNYVLTAARCTSSASYVELILGAHNLNIQEASQMRLTSSSIIIHEDYMKPDQHDNDISLIKTPNHIVTNEYIQIVPLADAVSGTYTGYVADVSGWGTTSDSTPTMSPVLLQTHLVIQANFYCVDIFGPDVIKPSTMCGSNGREVIGPCNGDSGAPLVAGNVQVGIASFIASSGCDSTDPSGYTRISYFRPWINKNTDL